MPVHYPDKGWFINGLLLGMQLIKGRISVIDAVVAAIGVRAFAWQESRFSLAANTFSGKAGRTHDVYELRG